MKILDNILPTRVNNPDISSSAMILVSYLAGILKEGTNHNYAQIQIMPL